MNEQPHLEILSHNKVNRSTIIIGVIPVTAVTVIFVAAVWPFLSWIAYGSLSLLALAALYLAGRAYIDLRQRWYHAAIVHASEHGIINVVTWQHLPALPEPSVKVEEIRELSEEDRIDIERSKVLALRQQGLGLHAIENALGVPYNRVRDYVKTMEELQAKAKNAYQSEA